MVKTFDSGSWICVHGDVPKSVRHVSGLGMP